jgi:flagellar protein FlaG
MASVSASHLILFIASMVVAASVATVFADSVGQLSQSVEETGLDVSQNVRTDIEVITDSGAGNIYDGSDTVTLHVKNTGSRRLPAESGQLDVFVNGSYTTDTAVTVVGEDTDWTPGAVVRLEITTGLASGDHRIKLIIGGDEEVFRFRT